MALRAKKPEIKDKRLKLFMFGAPGSRKTTSAIQFPKAVIIDMERGTEEYKKSIEKAGSIVLKTTDADEVMDEVRELLTTKHEYRTLIIDPVTIFYQSLQDKWSRIFEKYAKSEKEKALQDFGMRYWGRVKGEYKSFLRMLFQLDMNVIITSHQKDIYGPGMQKTGIGPDSMKGDDYVFDYVFRLQVANDKCLAITEKQRCEPLDPPKFPSDFEWSYANFCKFYGTQVIEKESVPVPMATPDQVREIKKLVDLVRLEDEVVSKWFSKANVDDFDQMTADQVEKCIKFIKTKLKDTEIIESGEAA